MLAGNQFGVVAVIGPEVDCVSQGWAGREVVGSATVSFSARSYAFSHRSSPLLTAAECRRRGEARIGMSVRVGEPLMLLVCIEIGAPCDCEAASVGTHGWSWGFWCWR